MPGAFDGVSAEHLEKVQNTIASGEWAKDSQANDWAGHAVAEVLGLDADDPADREKIKTLLKTWIENLALKVAHKPVKGKSRDRPVIVVGNPI